MKTNPFKRAFDLTVTVPLIAVLSPLLGILALVVRKELGTPVVFRQRRPGLHGAQFTIHKFRSMTDELDSEGKLLPDEERLPPLGHFLRRSSLDELPELFNVLKGDMSLVGPRPLRIKYLTRYSAEQARRHEVRPGITGWAQVNGRNALTWGQKFELDVWYVDNWSFWLDLKILWLTLRAVLVQEGISAEGHVTMPEFMGTEQDQSDE